jgi:hypothetical protein
MFSSPAFAVENTQPPSRAVAHWSHPPQHRGTDAHSVRRAVNGPGRHVMVEAPQGHIRAKIRRFVPLSSQKTTDRAKRMPGARFALSGVCHFGGAACPGLMPTARRRHVFSLLPTFLDGRPRSLPPGVRWREKAALRRFSSGRCFWSVWPRKLSSSVGRVLPSKTAIVVSGGYGLKSPEIRKKSDESLRVMHS